MQITSKVLKDTNRATVHSASGAVDVGPCLPPPDYPVPCRAQQSSRQAEGEERVSVRGGGHLEAAGLE